MFTTKPRPRAGFLLWYGLTQLNLRGINLVLHRRWQSSRAGAPTEGETVLGTHGYMLKTVCAAAGGFGFIKYHLEYLIQSNDKIFLDNAQKLSFDNPPKTLENKTEWVETNIQTKMLKQRWSMQKQTDGE